MTWKDPCEDYYHTLGVKQDAPTSEIRKAWHQKSLLLHPDKQRGLSHSRKILQTISLFFSGFGSVGDAFLSASKAMEVLIDAEKRKEYDTNLYHCRQAQKTASSSSHSFQHGFQGSIPRNIYGFTVKSLDRLSSKVPILSIPVHFIISIVDYLILYQQMNGTFKFVVFLLFILFLISIIIPMMISIILRIIGLPFNFLSKSIGLDARVEKKRTEGLRKARERQAELFAATKSQPTMKNTTQKKPSSSLRASTGTTPTIEEASTS